MAIESNQSTITQEAINRVRNEREQMYGHPAVNFERIAKFWNHYLEGRGEISPRDVAYMMILLKVARQMEIPTRDNLVDIIGYVQCVEAIDDLESTTYD